MEPVKDLYAYWGKAWPQDADGPSYHLLAYHSLDVAAVAEKWWEKSAAIRRAGCTAFCCSPGDETATRQLRAWILFFIALHDFGKFDVRFQMKAPDALCQCWPDLDFRDVDTAKQTIRSYAHDEEGYSVPRACGDEPQLDITCLRSTYRPSFGTGED